MKKIIVVFIFGLFLYACGGGNGTSDANSTPAKSMIEDEKPDDGKGVGEYTNVELNEPLNQDMVTNGKAIYDLKCAACHKLGPNRVVGPGFKGVTDRRKPEWILNMVTNVEVMLEEDAEARKLLEECLTRMPNQNLTSDDARDVLEFLINNDKAS